MNLHNSYYYFKSALSEKFCDEVIHYALQQKETLGLTGSYEKDELNKKNIKKLKQIRNSDLVWLNENWIYKEVQPYVSMANEAAGWNFQWDSSEQIQFTKYKLNQFYDWHCDSWDKPYDKPNEPIQHRKIRKLSMTCQLTDGSEYRGGELEFDFRNKNPKENTIHQCKEILPKGSVIVFPSFVWHRVKPITAGTRYSLVLWNLGYPFK